MITNEQRKMRAGLIGASSAPAICGIDPFASVADVWAQIKGLVTVEENAAMRRGTYLEPALLSWARDEIGRDFARDVMAIHADGIRAANFDGVGEDFIVEAKTSKVDDGWGEPGTDEVPDRVKVQVAQQFDVAEQIDGVKRRTAYVVGLIAMDLRLYVVERDDTLVDAVRDRVTQFAREDMHRDTPPEGAVMSIDVLKRLRREPNKLVEIATSIVADWRAHKDMLAAQEKREETARAQLIQAMGDAEGATAGVHAITFMEQSRTDIDRAKLKNEFPDAYAACVRETRYRVLRHKMAKLISPSK